MSLEKFFLCVESAGRIRRDARKEEVADLVASIQMALNGKGLKEYLTSLDGDGTKS